VPDEGAGGTTVNYRHIHNSGGEEQRFASEAVLEVVRTLVHFPEHVASMT
jgi:hypothetical protein